MGASMQRIGPDLGNLNVNVPPLPIPGLTPNRENQYLQRIKELENEVRQARIENEKNVRNSPPSSHAPGLTNSYVVYSKR